jgi:hypothetical protein
MATTTMQNSTENVKGRVSKKAINAKRKVQTRGSGKSKVKAADGLTTQLYRQSRDAVSSVYDSAAKAGVRASDAMPKIRGNLHLRSRSHAVYAMMEERPLVMGAVGLGVGMVLAALLPSVTNHRHQR